MNKKVIIGSVVLLSIAGFGLWYWNKNKKSTDFSQGNKSQAVPEKTVTNSTTSLLSKATLSGKGRG